VLALILVPPMVCPRPILVSAMYQSRARQPVPACAVPSARGGVVPAQRHWLIHENTL
jgi:hypothetical protein